MSLVFDASGANPPTKSASIVRSMQNVSGRIPELDGLRGIAIAMVLAFHAGVYVPVPWAPLGRAFALGWSGVDLFFVLSGFLIGGILIDQRASVEFFQPFYVRRVFRILPPYLLVVGGYAIAWVLCGGAQSDLVAFIGAPMAWWAYVTFTNNLFLAFHGMHYFLPTTWSLAVEEQFYLTLPLLVRFLPSRWLPRLVMGAIAAVLCLRFAACASGIVTQNEAYVLPWFRADSLMIGVGCAMIVRSAKAREFLQRWRVFFYVALGVLGFTVWRIGWWLPPDNGTPATPLMEYGLTLLSLLYGGILLTAVLVCPQWFSKFLRLRSLRFLGGISYFVYLAHQSLLLAALQWVPDLQRWKNAADWSAVVAAYAATMLLGHFSWKYFESPLIAFGHRWHSTRREQKYIPPVEIAA